MTESEKGRCCECHLLRDFLPSVSWPDVLNSVGDVMAGVLNSDAQFLWVNHNLAAYLLCSPQDCIGEYVYDLLPGETLKGQLSQGDKSGSVFIDDEERKKTLKCSVLPLGGINRSNGYILTLSDVTEVFDLREDLNYFRGRTEISQELKTGVLTRLNLEMRTSLTSMMGLVEFLRETDLQLDQQSYVEGIYSCVEQLVGLVDSVISDDCEEHRAEGYPEAGFALPVVEILLPAEEFPEKPAGHALLVESNKVNAGVFKKMLESVSVAVDIVTEGEKAVEKAGSFEYDVILMGCELDGMDGYETARRIRAIGLRVPIIALTANTESSVSSNCRDAGMDGCLTKPVRKEQLCEAVKNVISLGAE